MLTPPPDRRANSQPSFLRKVTLDLSMPPSYRSVAPPRMRREHSRISIREECQAELSRRSCHSISPGFPGDILHWSRQRLCSASETPQMLSTYLAPTAPETLPPLALQSVPS